MKNRLLLNGLLLLILISLALIIWLKPNEEIKDPKISQLSSNDITTINLYRASKTDIRFIVDNKNVVFIDDVLFSGRSIRAALTAIQTFGRPNNIELLVLIDRRFSRHLPIQPDYKGRQVDVIKDEKVRVAWNENDGIDAVYILNSDNK